ncbi:IS4 family transposase, partial [Brevibacillus laterosporus]|nr:IS4 family transposase [Brevibacillus laterosporus]
MEILDELQLFSQKLLQSQELVALCVWLSQKVASTSLMKLCSRLEAYTGILMSPEGLNKRFNRQAV